MCVTSVRECRYSLAHLHMNCSRRRSHFKYWDLQVNQFSLEGRGLPWTPLKMCVKSWGLPWKLDSDLRGIPWRKNLFGILIVMIESCMHKSTAHLPPNTRLRKKCRCLHKMSKKCRCRHKMSKKCRGLHKMSRVPSRGPRHSPTHTPPHTLCTYITVNEFFFSWTYLLTSRRKRSWQLWACRLWWSSVKALFFFWGGGGG